MIASKNINSVRSNLIRAEEVKQAPAQPIQPLLQDAGVVEPQPKKDDVFTFQSPQPAEKQKAQGLIEVFPELYLQFLYHY